jgi:hypothetical protein
MLAPLGRAVQPQAGVGGRLVKLASQIQHARGIVKACRTTEAAASRPAVASRHRCTRT